MLHAVHPPREHRRRELAVALPANVATPGYLAARAREIAEQHDSVDVEVLGQALHPQSPFAGQRFQLAFVQFELAHGGPQGLGG